jgi:hypothetical protein
MEAKVASGISSSAWTTVFLLQKYTTPIPICTVQYDTSTIQAPAVVRMQNVASQSFQIRLQNPSNVTISGRDVHCLIVEEGAFNLPDGRKIEAKKYGSTVTDHDLGWNGQGQTYINRYTFPTVLGQVMTYTDWRWSVFYSRSSTNRNLAPNPLSALRTGKHLGEDSPITRLVETVGYVVIEKGHATYNGIEMESGRTPESVVGYVDKSQTYSFATPFTGTPAVTVASQVGMNSPEGSWAIVTGNRTSAYFGVAVDEDQTADAERTHIAEEVDYIVFATAGFIQLTK